MWKETRIHRMMAKKERKLLHKEKDLDRYLNPGFPVSKRFRNTNCRTSLTTAGVYIAYEEQGDPMRIADEQDKVRKKEDSSW